MSDATNLKTAAEVTAERRVDDFIALARQQLTNLIGADQWDDDIWDISGSIIQKGKPRAASRLHFYKFGTLQGSGETATGSRLEPGIREFAKAFIRYTQSASPMKLPAIKGRLAALSHIEAAFTELGSDPAIHLLSPDVLNRAVDIAIRGGCAPMVKYQRGSFIEKVYVLCSQQNLLSTPFQWRHGIKKPPEPGERIGVEFEQRRSDSLPSRRALEALAHVYRNPKNLRDELLSAICLICICSPWRGSEVLQLRLDCEVQEMRREGSGNVPAFGLRAFPGKGNQPQVKWIPDVAAGAVRQAIERLARTCKDARDIASWYVAHLGKMYLPSDLAQLRDQEWLSGAELGSIIGQQQPDAWAKRQGLRGRRTAGGKWQYRFSDVEKVVLEMLPRDFPNQNGLPSHLYSEALILVRKEALRANAGAGSRVMFEPIDINQFNNWLSGTSGRPAVFERYGFTEEDGSRISITTHSFRHWNNNLGHRAGLSQEDLALWSGRDPAQNKYYDHQNAAEFMDDLLELALKAGGVGPIFEAADNLPDMTIISRDEFLREQIGSSHATEVGACFHDYALQPCQNHGDCLTCEENGFVKGDAKHRERIAGMLQIAELQLADARSGMSDGDYGADLWVQEHQRKAERLRLILAKHDDDAIADGLIVTLPAGRSDSQIEQALRLRDERQRPRRR